MKPRILIVEDDTIIAAELEARLQDLGYAVCGKTGTAENAVILAEGLSPDLVLMDIRLKAEMDGVEAAALIRANFDIPVIYLTAYADDDTLQRAKVTEPYGYIIKPFEERELYTTIEMGLHKHKLETKLRESERWLSATLYSISDGVVATDPRGYIAFTNRVAEKLIGRKQDKLAGLQIDGVLSLLEGDGRSPVSNPVGGVLQQGYALNLADHWLRNQSGSELPIEGAITPIRNDRGHTLGAVVVLRDISRRKQEEKEREELERRLFLAQKNEALAAMAGSLVHRFNNLMTAIIGSASLILAYAPADDLELREGAERIKQAGQSATSLLCQVLPQERQQIIRPQVLDPDAALATMVEGLVPLAGPWIEVRYRPGHDEQFVRVDPAQLDEMVTQLANNAIEAMPEGGLLTLATDVVCLEEEDCQDEPLARPGTFLRLSISDTGMGMDEETIGHIFEPFFTTRAANAGLGLPTVAALLRQNSGWIQISTALGQGTTAHVYLPAVSRQEEAMPMQEARPAPPEAGERHKRILLIEDDEKVRAAVANMLEARGYEVARADCAQMALELFEAEGSGFDLLFSDVVLPDRDGLGVADYCLSQQPGLRALFTSGYTDQRACWPLINERGYHFLQKPFDLQELLAAVDRALSQPAPPPATSLPRPLL